jgi:hypothetical protein
LASDLMSCVGRRDIDGLYVWGLALGGSGGVSEGDGLGGCVSSAWGIWLGIKLGFEVNSRVGVMLGASRGGKDTTLGAGAAEYKGALEGEDG